MFNVDHCLPFATIVTIHQDDGTMEERVHPDRIRLKKKQRCGDAQRRPPYAAWERASF